MTMHNLLEPTSGQSAVKTRGCDSSAIPGMNDTFIVAHGC